MYLKYSIKVPNDVTNEIITHLASQEIHPEKTKNLEIYLIKTDGKVNKQVSEKIVDYMNKIKYKLSETIGKENMKLGFKSSKYYVQNNDLILELECNHYSLIFINYLNILFDYFKVDNVISSKRPCINLGRVDKKAAKMNIKHKDKIFYLKYTNN